MFALVRAHVYTRTRKINVFISVLFRVLTFTTTRTYILEPDTVSFADTEARRDGSLISYENINEEKECLLSRTGAVTARGARLPSPYFSAV